LSEAMEMIADRVIDTRRRHGWEDVDEEGRPLRRSMSFAHLGGATLDNEENYLIKKLFTALGAIQIENQARI
jgi:formate dehydrogenase major subunit